jgi:hypothetical protein
MVQCRLIKFLSIPLIDSMIMQDLKKSPIFDI